jgi:uncharacterized protein YjiS (DUF1127 family)
MMFPPLIGVAPITYSTHAIRRISAWLLQSFWHWRAKRRERFFFGSLNEYEVERLAKDIGLSRTELLTKQPRPTPRSLAPSLPGHDADRKPAASPG